MQEKKMEDIVSLCKKRGFIFPSSSIYGGLQGVYDFGPLGVELKKNLREAWWKSMVYERDDIEGLDSAILTNPLILRHSGHENTFTDPLVDCKKCKCRMRADKLKEAGKCDYCGSNDLTEPRNFNLMFKTNVGPVDDGSSFAYLRPETAQGIFTNFRNVLDTTSRTLPFGIAQTGKAFRNEITPKNFLFRVREFEQMEMEFFVEPGTDEEWHKYWLNSRVQWWLQQGLNKDNLKLQAQTKEELAHYAKATTDILYKFPHGFDEIEGVANRQDFDLASHTKSQEEFKINAKVPENKDSNTKLNYLKVDTKESFIPFVIEPSAGLERGLLAILVEAYNVEKVGENERVVMKFKKHLAPVKVAIIPLAKNNEKIVAKCHEIKEILHKLGIGKIRYEDTGNVGKAYRRNDEIGTPLCITVDFETFEKAPESVTIRDRDSMEQIRINIADLKNYISDYFN
ncbi:MAG: glycine--tRNA ligase [Rickettsiales bacterium]|nr:glycine--tRNA ligase [Rickettsiales bacterium]